MVRLRRNVRPMIPAEEISRRVAELGLAIEADYSGRDLLLIGLLKGAFPFFADLARAIDLDFRLGFMNVSSYGSALVSSGDVKIVWDSDVPVFGMDVLIVEDIVDTGRTLSKVVGALQDNRPASVRICALLDKPSRRVVDVPVDYIGFGIEDEYVVGYGMDADGLYRNLPFVGVYGPA